MKIQSGDDAMKIAGVAAAIESDPSSWIGWQALRMDASGIDEDAYAEAQETAGMVLDAYMGNMNGAVYIGDSGHVYFVCKNASSEIMFQAAGQLRDMVFGGRMGSAQCVLYDLGRQGREFAAQVYADIGTSGATVLQADGAEDMPAWMHGQGYGTGPQGRRKTVLLVEDDPVVRWMVRQALRSECELLSADTAGKAFATYAECRPDIVLLDIGLPDDSGNAVLTWIMHNDPAACVIMMSGRDDVDSISGCMALGAKGFIAKPFVRNILLDYVRRYG